MILSQDNHTYISASSGSNVYIRNGGNDSTNQLIIGSGNNGLTWRSNAVWHSGNDGSGSGLDSDTLDGVQGASYLRSDVDDTLAASLTCRAITPQTNNTFNLGSSSVRWANIYTNDLNLSNEGGANDVDGTFGSYTIQEGAEDLFLINRRNGKKYKFNLTEV